MKEAVISTSRLNSYGSRVLTEGIALDQYKKNPILLYMHRRYGREDMPIGIMENLRVDNGVLYGTPKFDDDTEEERTISKKWERGTLRMLSAGLDVLEWSEDPALLIAGQTRPTVTKSKLIEVSVVDIGSNDDALQVSLYNDGKLLTLAAGEENEHLPLLKQQPVNDEDDDKTQNNETRKSMKKILLKLGLAPTATEDDAVAAIGQLQSERTAINLARITEAVETAVRERRITADKKDKYLNLGKQHGYDTLADVLADMSPVQKPLDLVRQCSSAAMTDLSLKWETATADQLEKLRDENRAEYIRLYKAYFGAEPQF